MTKCASKATAHAPKLSDSQNIQIVANPGLEHKEKMTVLADLAKRLNLLKTELGLKESDDGALEVASRR